MKKNDRLWLKTGWLSLIVLMIDQVTKLVVFHSIHRQASPFIPLTPFLNMVSVGNRGISFGLFQNFEISNHVFFCLTLIITLLLIKWNKDTQEKWLSLALWAIIGGAVGNNIDRLRWGAVFDFIDIHISHYHWPAFNVADSAICIGACMASFHWIVIEKNKKGINHE